MQKFDFSFTCDQDPMKMPEIGNTRHCSECSRNIIDLRTFTPQQIIEYKKKNIDPCGFMMPWQVDQVNEYLNANRKTIPLMKYAKIAAAIGSPLLFNPAFAQRNTNPTQTVSTITPTNDAASPKREITEVLVLDSLGEGIPQLQLDLYDGESFIKTVKTGNDCKVYINHGEMRGISSIVLKNEDLNIEKTIVLKNQAVCMIWRADIKKEDAAEIREISFQFLLRSKKNEKPLLRSAIKVDLYDSTNSIIETLHARTNAGGYLTFKSKKLGKADHVYFSAETTHGYKSTYMKTSLLGTEEVTKVKFYHYKRRKHHGYAIGKF